MDVMDGFVIVVLLLASSIILYKKNPENFYTRFAFIELIIALVLRLVLVIFFYIYH
jgi:hypothetical protein